MQVDLEPYIAPYLLTGLCDENEARANCSIRFLCMNIQHPTLCKHMLVLYPELEAVHAQLLVWAPRLDLADLTELRSYCQSIVIKVPSSLHKIFDDFLRQEIALEVFWLVERIGEAYEEEHEED